MQTRPNLDRTLETLAFSKRCTPNEASAYRDKLVELAKQTINEPKVDALSKVFKALGDETRLRILFLLKAQEMCVCELMAALDLTQPTASHHLMILENADMVKHRKEGKWVFYSIADMGLIRELLALNL